MTKQTTINDADIRARSVAIEKIAQEIETRARLLIEHFNALYPNLRFADPVKHVGFDRYMRTMAGLKLFCDQMPSLEHQAREMQLFGKEQLVADVSALNRVTTPVAAAAIPA